MPWNASGATDLPLADSDREWDGDAATESMFEWARKGDEFKPHRVRLGHFAYNTDDTERESSYKLPFAHVINGELKAVPRGIHAVAAVLEGARGGVDLPDDVIRDIRKRVEAYYERMGEDVPW